MKASFDSRDWLRWERRCVERARRGDQRAFGELYRAFAGPLYNRVLYPRLGHAEAAEDVLAETFRVAYERLDQFEDRGGSIWYWLCRIGINKATDMYRKRARRSRALVNFEHLLTPVAGDPTRPDVAEEQRQERRRLRRAVQTVLERIKPRYRRAIELRFFEQRSRTECADMMEVRVGTFDVLILRSLRAFRKQWLASAATPSMEN